MTMSGETKTGAGNDSRFISASGSGCGIVRVELVANLR
jgi:hypothetical protein